MEPTVELSLLAFFFFFPHICMWQSFKSLIETISLSGAELWSSASTNSPSTSKGWLTWVNCSWAQSLKELGAGLLFFFFFPSLLSHGEGRNPGVNPAQEAGGQGSLGATVTSRGGDAAAVAAPELPADRKGAQHGGALYRSLSLGGWGGHRPCFSV